MAKKTLDGKISSAIFWLLMFFISYFIIGFVLKVDLSSQFNANAFYDVLNDSLTLLAYFLAPVTALLLFSDWRQQHASINNEQISKELLNILDEFNNFYNIQVENFEVVNNFYEFRSNFFQKLTSFSTKCSEINQIDDASIKFSETSKEIYELLFNYWFDLSQEASMYFEYKKVANGTTQQLVALAEVYAKKQNNAQQQKFEKIQRLRQLRTNLSILHV
ncbi:hypothetical protein NDN13_05200 [Acinetobacter sp. C32I]|uniref:hypothetical protein n=1 Tax=Acinetobacter sp. C32I TaxID=2950074 RepID=UPI00203728AD|nr:hypothetical protein [Acinetobacter sp. C32I]USA54593.1 hypothetical protein NDN13_05200 [Acinetobacter sp. C32I]